MKPAQVNPAVFLLFAVLAVFLPAAPAAAYMSALVEFDYNTSRTEQNDSAGSQTSKSIGFLQRYLLNINQDIFPTVTFRGGYVFERNLLKARTDDVETKTTLIRMSPSFELGFKNPFVGATVGYNEITQKNENRGNPTRTLTQENWTASFGLARREDRPTFNVMYSQSHSFDKERTDTDTVTEQVLVTSRYQPYKPLDMKYSGTWSESRDNLNSVDTENILHSGRVIYNDTFFQGRTRVYSNYNVTMSVSETRAAGSGAGEVTIPVLPFAGLAGPGTFGTDNPPETVDDDTLVSRPALIDGKTDVGAGINIGYSAVTTGPRNIGLDLGEETEVSMLHVSVNQMLPPSISSTFTWRIYISSDTSELKHWTLWQTIPAAPFGTFNARFELLFDPATTRFIKVVVDPLGSPAPVAGVDVDDILVTEIQPFVTETASSGDTTMRNTGQRFEAGANVKVLDFPNLYYDIYYWKAKSDLKSFSPSMMINGLTLNQRLSRIFSTSAMVRRTDSHIEDGLHLKYDYGASLTAQPLPSLFHSVRYTRQTEELKDQHLSRSDFVYFNNSATIYPGVSVNFSVSEGDTTSEGRQTKSSTVTSGSTLVPYRTLTINLYNTRSESRTSGGDSPAFRSDKESSSASFAYTPTRTFYLFGSYAVSKTSYTDRPDIPVSRVQTYTASWSPLLSGALWFTVLATQALSSGDDEETTISPQLRWIVNPSATIEAGYQMLTKKNSLMTTRTNSLFASLKLLF